MEIAELIEARRPRWSSLEGLLDKAEATGLRSLSLEEARQLSRLYRGASSDLLRVRARGSGAEVTEYLNDLVGRAYALTYPGRRGRLSDVVALVLRGVPDLIRQEWRMLVASTLMFAVGAGFGYLGMAYDKDAAHYLIPEQHFKVDPRERVKEEASNEVADAQQQAAFTTFLFTHNIQVAFLAFALGITLGVGTALMMFSNGMLLGSLLYAYASRGLTGWFWAWILPHGIPEITAICIAGAAGLVIARGLIAPRGLPRRLAVRREATTAVKMLLGTLMLFVIAGFIEGTISQIHPPRLSITFKISFALAVGAGVYAYLLSGFFRRAPA
jgi:uncharacterized membrane protein SpoIIM required for sporulation